MGIPHFSYVAELLPQRVYRVVNSTRSLSAITLLKSTRFSDMLQSTFKTGLHFSRPLGEFFKPEYII